MPGPVVRVPAACEATAQPGKIVDRNGGAIGAGIPLPEIVVGTLRGQALADREGVAGAVGDARDCHGLAVVNVKHAAERADRISAEPHVILSIVPCSPGQPTRCCPGTGGQTVIGVSVGNCMEELQPMQ